MKKVTVLLAGALATLSLIGPVGAQTTTPSTSDPASREPSVTKPSASKTPSTKHMTGTVVSVDPSAKTLTVKHGLRSKEATLTVDDTAAAQLSDLKPGDKVKVSYVADGQQMTAKQIEKNEKKSGRAAPKDETSTSKDETGTKK